MRRKHRMKIQRCTAKITRERRRKNENYGKNARGAKIIFEKRIKL
jgi:hypothetical protein